MLKKSALTTLAVAAGLVAGAPLASAVEAPELPGTESGAPVFGEGNDGQFHEENVFGENNGEGNTFNGQEIALF